MKEEHRLNGKAVKQEHFCIPRSTKDQGGKNRILGQKPQINPGGDQRAALCRWTPISKTMILEKEVFLWNGRQAGNRICFGEVH